MIAIGIILLIIGFVTGIAILWTIGIILVVIGVILALLGMMGRAIGGQCKEIGNFEQHRSRGQPPAAAGRRCSVRPAGPDRDRHLAVVSDRPSVAEPVGGAGLERE